MGRVSRRPPRLAQHRTTSPSVSWRQWMRDLIQRYGLALSITFAGLAAFWLLMLVIFPYVFLGEQSFRPYLPVAQIGGPNDNYTLSNYVTFFTSPIHVHVFLLTVFFSSLVTVLTLALA